MKHQNLNFHLVTRPLRPIQQPILVCFWQAQQPRMPRQTAFISAATAPAFMVSSTSTVRKPFPACFWPSLEVQHGFQRPTKSTSSRFQPQNETSNSGLTTYCTQRHSYRHLRVSYSLLPRFRSLFGTRLAARRPRRHGPFSCLITRSATAGC